MAYYLHDKGAQTAERVAWAETRNLMTDDPRAAMRIMVATAQSADELKAAAGVRAAGRKSNAHVYAYSLAWHPDEAGQLDRAEMLRAADSSLKVLGAENHQAVIVCHQDQKHPHIHVIVNRVDPATGKMLSTSNDRLKLSDWANAYERERGVILTPKREEKRELREKFAEQTERRQYAAEKRQQAAKASERDKTPAATLKAFSDQQKATHKQEWADLSAKNKAARNRVFAESGAAIKEAAARHKAECKPVWAAFFRQQREGDRQFQAREKTLSGIVQNAMLATTQQKVSGQLGNRGTLSATFGNVLSSHARAKAFEEIKDMNRRELSAHLKSILDTEIHGIKEKRDSALAAQRQTFSQERARLIERQDKERGKIREAWRQIYAERDADRARRPYQPKQTQAAQIERKERPHRGINAEAYRDRYQRPEPRQKAQAIPKPQAQEKPAPRQEQKPMKDRFDNARRMPERTAPAPSRPDFIAQAQPAPSPSGDVPKPAPKRLQDVPLQKPATRTPAQQKVVAAKKDWSASAPKPAPTVKKDWSKTTEQRLQDKPAPRPTLARDRDRDRDR